MGVKISKIWRTTGGFLKGGGGGGDKNGGWKLGGWLKITKKKKKKKKKSNSVSYYTIIEFYEGLVICSNLILPDCSPFAALSGFNSLMSESQLVQTLRSHVHAK